MFLIGALYYVLFTDGPGLIYFNLTNRTSDRGIQLARGRMMALTVDGDFEKVKFSGSEYQLKAIEVSFLFVAAATKLHDVAYTWSYFRMSCIAHMRKVIIYYVSVTRQKRSQFILYCVLLSSCTVILSTTVTSYVT